MSVTQKSPKQGPFSPIASRASALGMVSSLKAKAPVSEGNTRPVYETIHAEPNTSFRWHQHDYPDPLARWNHHPEYELHLITQSEGRAIIGDYIGSFGPRQLVLVGPDLPHGWFSPLKPGEVLTGRDVVLQFSAKWIEGLMALCPELGGLRNLLQGSTLGVEFTGPEALALGEKLEAIGTFQGARKLAACLDLLATLTSAPFRTLSLKGETKALNSPEMQRMSGVITSLMAMDPSEIRHDHLAQDLGLCASTFSRQFRSATGDTFMSFLHRLRVCHACHLLASSTLSITEIGAASGFNNLSNFNRIFLRLRGCTPREYRRHAREMTALPQADAADFLN
ncbi:transcriptional regulator AraC [Gluconobacter thailandicus F149-1 = NBRC 100600]|uniref:AraC family transcriptional regulator n=1 Tax=Gluconobacter thailandicus NBRC 3257 TaxID=1381097 RepID=A0ABQ0IWM8_GLUTH|nr:helix-turn-helix domain-containing protein [Gluconobacter thailandicus]KXV52665.1 AraC family transcriptional regulator [Gluconobacter thailandicus]GAC87942.1 AraC family transcriptional regulator [Gluconobacter thailandicus NBRC 3255]GAD26612.1 AraC family transcriptional regulator [Gluconobacter thailandicus NBRC 3257]GAN92729.1 transcriptional regulator AraC [Gluconobacter thailandicus F149-1 = NBRC 100600]GBR57426.1 AraC family transcriptional regulator [Gluconobacter thailandicus F149-